MSNINPVFSQKERNVIILIIILVLGGILLYALNGIFGAILGTLVMYTLFRKMNIRLVERYKWPKPLASISIILLSLFIIIIPVFAVGSMLFQKIIELQQNPDGIKSVLASIDRFVDDKFGQQDWIENELQSSLTYVGSWITSILGGATAAFVEVAVMYFILYFLFTSYKDFEQSITEYLPFSDEDVKMLGLEMKNMTYMNVLGQTLIAVAQGITMAIGLWFFGVSDPIFWGTVCAVLSFIPLFGPPFIFIPAALVLFAQSKDWQAIGLLIYGFAVVINVDNVLRLILSRKIGNIHPIIAIIGLIIGVPLFGIVGLVFGPLLLSYFLITVKIFKINKSQSLKKETLEDRINN